MADQARTPSPSLPTFRGEAGFPPLRVLFLVHNHPAFHPGGAEIYALDLHRAMREREAFDPVLVAASVGHDFPGGADRAFYRVATDDPSEYIWHVPDFDHFSFTARDKKSYTRDLRSLLRSFRPHVVHIQHTLRLGLEALTEIRRTCPAAPIVHTLHEFLPICYSRGIMLRRGTDERCASASPWRCHQCFPEHSPEEFLLRERFIKAQLELVDLFLAPSRFLLEKYVEWGIPEGKIRFHDYGRRIPPAPSTAGVDLRRFVFLGQAMRHKGILVLLEAMRLLIEGGKDDVRLSIEGANMEFEGDRFVREVKRKLEECDGRVALGGAYTPDEIPDRLEKAAWVVVPSIWWENSPLVIQEAFMHRRPVICSNVGGMAEKVRHGVDGLHFRAGDPAHLAEVLAEAAGNDPLWRRLQKGIPEIFPLDDAVSELEEIYHELIRTRRAAAVA